MSERYVSSATKQTQENRFKSLAPERIQQIKDLRATGLSVPKTAQKLGLSETVVRKYSREFPFSRNAYGTPRHVSREKFTPEQIAIAMQVLEIEEKRKRDRAQQG